MLAYYENKNKNKCKERVKYEIIELSKKLKHESVGKKVFGKNSLI